MITQWTTILEVELPLKDVPILGGAAARRQTDLFTGDGRKRLANIRSLQSIEPDRFYMDTHSW